MTTREIWEKRKLLLEKARRKELTFNEFCLLDMHKQTKNLISKNGGLSDEGISTLNAITMYLENINREPAKRGN